MAIYHRQKYLVKQRFLVLQRARGLCEICGNKAFYIHHLDADKSNHELTNLVAVCTSCHGVIHSNRPIMKRNVKTSKYIRIYGMSLRQIGELLGIMPATVYQWLQIPEKKALIEKKIAETQKSLDKRPN
jgi:hypothetical protein